MEGLCACVFGEGDGYVQRTLRLLLVAPVLSRGVIDGVGVDYVGPLGGGEGEEGGEGEAEDCGGGIHLSCDLFLLYVCMLFVCRRNGCMLMLLLREKSSQMLFLPR